MDYCAVRHGGDAVLSADMSPRAGSTGECALADRAPSEP